MNAPAPKPSAAGQALTLFPGVSFYQVLEPSKVLAADGGVTYGMYGPFPDLASATHHAATRPGALITVTLVLHQASAMPAAVAPMKQG